MSDEGTLAPSELSPPPPVDPDPSWETTRVSSIQEVREAEIESKQFELHREREEIDVSLVLTDVQLRKQVRAVTKECGKLRLEVAWLERDLSEVKEQARRQILEVQTVLQAKKLKLKDAVHAGAARLQGLQRKLTAQRDEIAQGMIAARSQLSNSHDDLENEVRDLQAEIDSVRQQLYQADRKFDEDTIEARQTMEMLLTEIRNIAAREPSLDRSMERQKQEMRSLQAKIADADRVSNVLREKVRKR
jgi:predicted  nucleic acid-binding Zn-ribbon protein